MGEDRSSFVFVCHAPNLFLIGKKLIFLQVKSGLTVPVSDLPVFILPPLSCGGGGEREWLGGQLAATYGQTTLLQVV